MLCPAQLPLIRHIRAVLTSGLLTVLLLAQPTPLEGQRADTGSASGTTSVRIVAALVLPDMAVRPVPLHTLELVSDADSSVRVSFRTGLDGTTTQGVESGRYRLRSMQPAILHDSTYRWDLILDVPVAGTSIELTNANAHVVASGSRQTIAASSAVLGARQVAPERNVFERVRRGVFRIESGLSHGTGFLIDTLGGLVVTNEHVVSNQAEVFVVLDTLTRVPAQVVIRDAEADLALLRLPPGHCADCPRLPLAFSPLGEPVVVAGERILAIGFPLSQEIMLTSGIASSIRDGAIISDVNINPGNSGGPMLNMAGEVVAVNTFLDPSSTVGAGVAGSVAIQRLGSLLDKTPAALAALPSVEYRALPSMPRDRYAVPLLKAFADTASPRAYQHFANRNAGRFTVSLSVPTQQMVFLKFQDDAVAGDRRRREQQAGVSAEEAYSGLKEVRDWLEYVGDATIPVIAVTVNPKIGETGGSAFGRALAAGLAGVALQAQFKFQGDVRGLRVYRNGVEIPPLRGGHAPQKVLTENQWVALRDVADMGYYVFSPQLFAPDPDGTPPRVTFVIKDLKNPTSLSTVDFYDGTSARIWNDFGPYFQSIDGMSTSRYVNLLSAIRRIASVVK